MPNSSCRFKEAGWQKNDTTTHIDCRYDGLVAFYKVNGKRLDYRRARSKTHRRSLSTGKRRHLDASLFVASDSLERVSHFLEYHYRPLVRICRALLDWRQCISNRLLFRASKGMSDQVPSLTNTSSDTMRLQLQGPNRHRALLAKAQCYRWSQWFRQE